LGFKVGEKTELAVLLFYILYKILIGLTNL